MIPTDLLNLEDIPKTMIFVDGLKEACRITTKLLNIIPRSVLKNHENIVREYSTGWCYYLFRGRTRLTTLVRECRAHNLEAFLSTMSVVSWYAPRLAEWESISQTSRG